MVWLRRIVLVLFCLLLIRLAASDSRLLGTIAILIVFVVSLIYTAVTDSKEKKRENSYQLDESFSLLQRKNSQNRRMYSNHLPILKRQD